MSLKRRFDDDSPISASSSSGDSLASEDFSTKTKRQRKVRFDEQIVFHFPRTQGYTCVPSNGGSTLGMKRQHSHVEHVRIPAENADEFSESEDSYGESDCDEDQPYRGFMPIPQKGRKAILKAAGVKKINKQEAIECMQIRYSRQICGCDCKEQCEPTSCLCCLNGINCQVDRDNFPCGCSRSGCENPNGRHEYDPISVRRHFIDTLLKLQEQDYVPYNCQLKTDFYLSNHLKTN